MSVSGRTGAEIPEGNAVRPAAAATSSPAKSEVTRKKRSFQEQRELDSLPALIETLETEVAALHAAMAEPDYYRQPGDVLARDQARLREFESRLAAGLYLSLSIFPIMSS